MLPSVLPPNNKSGPRLDAGVETAFKNTPRTELETHTPHVWGLKILELIPQHRSSGGWGGLPCEVEVKTPESVPWTEGPPKPRVTLRGSVPRAPVSHGLERAAVIFFT